MYAHRDDLIKFWEWVFGKEGVEFGTGLDDTLHAYRRTTYNREDKEWHIEHVELNLESLEQYAIPKIKVITMTNAYKNWTVTINQGVMIGGHTVALGESKDLTEAIFNALMKVVNNG